MVAIYALVTADVVGFENREWQPGKAADVDTVGRKPGSDVDAFFLGRQHVRQQHVPVDFLLVSNH